MSPSTSQPTGAKVAKVAKPVGKDIRSFFGGGGGSGSVTSSGASSSKPSKHFLPTPTKPTLSPSHGTEKADVIEIDADDEEEQLPIKSRSISTKRKAVPVSSDEDDEEKKKSPPKKKQAATPRSSNALPANSTPRARARIISSDEEEEKTEKKEFPKMKQVATPKAAPKTKEKAPTRPRQSISKSRKRKVDDGDYEKTNGDVNSDKKGKSKAKESAKLAVEEGSKKFNWAAMRAARMAGPSAPGSKSVPDGAPNCLAGLSFVFTGELSSFAREEAIDLAKRFGGRVVGQPSSVTSYVVLGDNAGPAKLAAIKKHGLKKLTEDEFLELIATRKGSDVDKKTKQKLAKEEENIRKAAEEMERIEHKAEKERAEAVVTASTASKGSGTKSKPLQDTHSQLWTTRYAPQGLKEICGNKGQVEKLQGWLHDWSSSIKSGFKKPGKNGMNIYRAVLITGPPGIGKTTSAHLCAKLEGFTPIELNASDARSKKLVENSTNVANTSLDGWMGGGKATNAAGIEITDKSCLIMDEVDGMSAGDRGGVGALNALIKKTRIPIICIANDRNAQKLKPVVHSTFNLSFRKPEAASIRSRIMTIAFKEKMKIPANVVDQLVIGAQSDIRQVLNMLSTWKLSSDSMDFDEGRDLAKLNEKYTVMTPFNENYLKTEPAKLRNAGGPEKVLQHLKLMDKAASSISDADLVDSLIHGPEQHWSLMPLHAVTSAVRPASFLYGNGAGYGGPNAMSFPQWLGQNSKQNKLTRQLGDVQIRMRLKVSGNKPEIRQHYIPALLPQIVKPLIDIGASAVEEVIETMDEYYLSKEDWDTIVELGLDQYKDDVVLKQISTATKTQLTRKYNAGEHPVPFHKAHEFGKVPKKLAGGPAPDLEEAFDLDEDVEEEPDQKDEDADAEDISKDSFIKAGGKGKGKSAAKGSAKTDKGKSDKAKGKVKK
ncbi:hypothetical protein EW145_g4345 [Phellinidium pouzarii]|uniref:Replication factor C subunit 1 n=1 Tax=Phellinidium pouzarii TaxID=167371 RepID=A0A4S4L4B5_9AGAM|nr:hypothetical protein EW145_g4345 [Phellinidium pouzarii]